jgi:hypothetical protein
MLRYRVGVGGSKAGAKATGNYLLEQSIPLEASRISRYYIDRQPTVASQDQAITTFALLINEEAISYPEALEELTAAAVSRGEDPELAEERLEELLINAMNGEPPPAHEVTAAEPRRDVAPALARLLGIDPSRSVGRNELANLLDGRRTDGKDVEGTSRNRRNSFVDFTFSPDKSVTLAYTFAPTEAEGAIIYAAHRDAVDRTAAHMAEVLGYAKRGDGGRKGSDQGELFWVKIDHYTARPAAEIRTKDAAGSEYTEIRTVKMTADPQLHTHLLMLNAILTKDGHVGGMDLDKLKGRLHEWDGLYHAFLATNLREHGIDVQLDHETGAARIVDIPQAARLEFSKRRRDATEAAREFAKERGLDWDALDDKAKIRLLEGGAKATRNAKDGEVELAEWKRQAAAIGWVHRSLLRPDQCHRMEPGHEHLSAAYEVATELLQDRFERNSVVTGADVRVAAARSLIASGTHGPEDINRLTAGMRNLGVLKDGELTELMWTKGEDGKFLVSTALAETQERELVDLVKIAHADRRLALSSAEIAAGVAKHPDLRRQQRTCPRPSDGAWSASPRPRSRRRSAPARSRSTPTASSWSTSCR